MTPSENRPHLVCRRGETFGFLFDTFQLAHAHWLTVTTLDDPHDILTQATGRVIDPGTPVIDCSE